MKNHLLKILLVFPLAIFSQVGIGTTAPNASSILDVTATDKGVLVPRIAITDLNTAAPVTTPVESLLVYNTTVGTGVGFHYWDGVKWTPLSGAAVPDTDWTIVGNDMHNANTGFVGVGTATPSVLLHIEDTAPAVRLVSGTEAAGLVLTTDASGNANWGTPSLDADWTVVGNDMYNANSGNVGVGTTSPVQGVHIVGDRVLLESTGNAVLTTLATRENPDRGYELVGTYTDPGFDQSAIYIAGYNGKNPGGNYDYTFDNASKEKGIFCGKNNGGNVSATLPITATAFNVSSSRRAKKNITTSQYGLNDILKIKPVKYQYNFDKSGLYTIGFIAEEVSEIIPEVVTYYDENGKVVSREEGIPISMDYSKMNAVLVNAVKEQQAEIDVLESENSALDKQITKLESLLF